MPKLKVTDDSALNAFASGLNEKQYSITVTSGLLDHLDDKEIEAVLGHELTHIRNLDVRMLVIATVIAGVIGFFAELLFRMMFQGGWRWGGGGRSSDSDRGKGGGGLAIVIAIALVAVAWLLSVVIRFALSRKREYLADAGSVELTKDPDAMISALRKIEGRGELEGATSAVMEMCIDNPREGFADLFATHPPIESRIAALIQFAGGHDPGPLDLPDEQESPHRTHRSSRSSRRPALERRRAAAQAVPALRAAGHARRREPARPSRSLGRPPKLIRRGTSHPLSRIGEMSPDPAVGNMNWMAVLPCFRPALARYRADSARRVGMAKPAVILVGADKGGVGKTTVSRALLDYFIAHNIPTRAFDTESPKGTLKRFHPDVTEVVDMHSTADQMKIFDTLSQTRR